MSLILRLQTHGHQLLLYTHCTESDNVMIGIEMK